MQRRIEIRRYNIGHPYGIFNVNILSKKMWVMDRVCNLWRGVGTLFFTNSLIDFL
jgi:hypothetical protein